MLSNLLHGFSEGLLTVGRSCVVVFSVQIITVEEAKRRKSTCSYYEDADEEVLPILQPHSALLENMHIEQVCFPGLQSMFHPCLCLF